MSDREQSPPMDVTRDEVHDDDDDTERKAPDADERKAPDVGEQQVDGGQMELDDDAAADEEYDDGEEDESDGEEEETDNGGEESDGEADGSDGGDVDESAGDVDESAGDVDESAGDVDESAGSLNAGQDNPADEEPREQYDYVYLRLISDIHPDEGFLVKTTEPMRNMKQLHHSQLNETQKQSLKQYFLYNGNLIADEDTPQSLGLKETDDIHVYHTMGEGIRVHTIETGEVRQLQL